MEPLNTGLSTLAAIGGISGIVTTWYYWRRFKKRLKIVDFGSWYEVHRNNSKNNKLVINIRMLLLNDSEINVSVTDATLLIRLSKKKLDNVGYPQGVLEGKLAKNEKMPFPIVIAPHSSKKIEIKYVFENVSIPLIDRCRNAYFLGWLEKTPLFIAIESEDEVKWNELPLIARFVLHIDADRIITKNLCVVKKADKEEYTGTINIIEREKAKREFWE